MKTLFLTLAICGLCVSCSDQNGHTNRSKNSSSGQNNQKESEKCEAQSSTPYSNVIKCNRCPHRN